MIVVLQYTASSVKCSPLPRYKFINFHYDAHNCMVTIYNQPTVLAFNQGMCNKMFGTYRQHTPEHYCIH